MELINSEICKNCGGFCCKKSGCDYYPQDFKDLSLSALLSILESGNISVVAVLKFEKLKNDKAFFSPLLYLRARNVNRDIIDLFSMKTTCSMLTENGCSYDESNRPSGGLNLIPEENYKCHPFLDPTKKIEEWESYQKVLRKVVKRITGMDVEDKLKEDIKNTYIDFFNGNIDNVNKLELQDIERMLPLVNQVYPEMINEIIKNLGKSKVKKIR